MILFTQSTVVLHKYLNDELKKTILFVTIFPEVAQNSKTFPCLEKSASIPGLWPPCKSDWCFERSWACARPQQQTCQPPPLLPIDGTDGRMLKCYIDPVLRTVPASPIKPRPDLQNILRFIIRLS